MKPFVTRLLQHVVILFAILLIACFTSRSIAADTNQSGNRPATTDTSQPARLTERVPDLGVADHFLLAVPKTGFGKDYLFTASLIPQAQAATSSGLAAKTNLLYLRGKALGSLD